jgi:hypothetical protein
MNASMIRAQAAFLDDAEPFRAPNLERYWSDPEYRAQLAAEREEHYRRANALIDEGIRKARERRAAAMEADRG